ncbi:FAD:protein FMN transferase [bacterium]|nr:FAD:protein FMN transferase [bacterium]
MFPGAASIEERTLWPDEPMKMRIREVSRLPFDAPYVHYLEIRNRSGILGYAFEDEVKGLHEMITYLAALNADGTIRAVEVLVYREAYGFEIKYDRFRKQFAGKTLSDPLRVGTDIRNIAGATISTNAISAGVRKILALYEAGIKTSSPLEGEAGRGVTFEERRGHTPSLPPPSRGRNSTVRRTQVIWGTTLAIEISGGGEGNLQAVIEAAFDEVDRLTPVFSRYDTASEISKINRRRVSTEVSVSGDFFDICRLALEMVKQTNAAFAPLDPPHLIQNREFFMILGAPKTIRLDTDVRLDLDGIAKGYAVDRMARILKEAGIKRALINFGESSIAAIGAPDGEAGWAVDVRDARRPHGEDVRPLVRLILKDAVLSVSGAYERGPHIINPFTGKPPPDSLQAVVVGPLGSDASAKADALSTALFAAGVEGMGFVEKAGFEALWLGGTGRLQTKNFEDRTYR